MQKKTSQFSSIRKRLLSGGAWAFAGKIASALTNLLISGLLTRLLDPDDVGVFFIVFSIVVGGSTLAQLGLNNVVVRFIAEAKAKSKSEEIPSIIINVLMLGLICSLTVALLLEIGVGELIAIHIFQSPLILSVIGIASIWIFTLTIQSLIAECFRGLHDIRLATLFQNLATNLIFLSLLTYVWIALENPSLLIILRFMVSAGLLSILFSSIILYKHIKSFQPSINRRSSLSKILITTWPILVTNITLFTLSQTSLWILGIYNEAEDVALYGAAVRLITLVAIPLLIANSVLPPLIAELHAQGKIQKLQRILRSTATITGLPAFVIVLFFMFLSDFILTTVYGEFYTNASDILYILSIGQLVNIWAGSCGITLMMTGHQKAMMSIALLMGLYTVVLSIIVVSTYGLLGVATVSTTSLIIQNILMLLITRKKVGVWSHAELSIKSIYSDIKG